MRALARLGAAVALGLAACGVEDGKPDPDSYLEYQTIPVGGLSMVEPADASPAQVTLNSNPAVMDGDVFASAGLDLGPARTLAGDTACRDAGLRFQFPMTAVDLLRVFVDRALPPAVSDAYAWSAYRSDDNAAWTEIPIAAPVIFDPESLCFEVRVHRTEAPYLKVLTRPLAAGVTEDPALASVWVTELEAFRLEPVR